MIQKDNLLHNKWIELAHVDDILIDWLDKITFTITKLQLGR